MKTKANLLSQQGCDKSCDRGGDVPEVRAIDDPDPCAAAGCAMQADPLETCRRPQVPAPLAQDGDVRHGLSHPDGQHQNEEGGTP